jgi:hypothetical protein
LDGRGRGGRRPRRGREGNYYERAWLALASALPSLVSLESLYLNQHDVGRGGTWSDVACNATLLTIALALKAWPKPRLTLRFFRRQTMFGDFEKELGLPADAWWSSDPPLYGYGDSPLEVTYRPTDAAVLRFFEAQQENVTAFVCGQVCWGLQVSVRSGLLCEVPIGSLLALDTRVHFSAPAAGRGVTSRVAR